MTYHINRRGLAARCRAREGYCPLGGSFESKGLAETEAKRVSDEYLEKERKINAEMNKNLSSQLEKGNWRDVEKEMHNYNSSALETVYNKLQDLREKGKNTKAAREELINKTNSLHSEKIDIVSKIEDDFINSSKEGKKLRKAHQAEDKFIEENAISEYATPSELRKFQEALSVVKGKKELAKVEFDKKVEEEAAKNPRYLEIEEELKECSSKKQVSNYIYHYEETAAKNGKPLPDKTPIETFYESRKAAEEQIEKKIGINVLAVNSSSRRSGRIKINEELVTDNKGRIANLYYEKTPGVPIRVIHVHEGKNGNIELEDGTSFTITNSNNYKVNFEPETVGSHRFYTTPPRGRKKYEGSPWLEINTIDTGD